MGPRWVLTCLLKTAHIPCHWYQNHPGSLRTRQQDLNPNENVWLPRYREAWKLGCHPAQSGWWRQHMPCGWVMSRHPLRSSGLLCASRIISGEFLIIICQKKIELIHPPVASSQYAYTHTQTPFLCHVKLSLGKVLDTLVIPFSWGTRMHSPSRPGMAVYFQKPNERSPL